VRSSFKETRPTAGVSSWRSFGTSGEQIADALQIRLQCQMEKKPTATVETDRLERRYMIAS
jgi:hypothetical protein